MNGPDRFSSRSHRWTVVAAAILIAAVGGLLARPAVDETVSVTQAELADDNSAQADNGEGAADQCDVDAAAKRLRSGLPSLNFEPSVGPEELAAASQAMVRGVILWGDPETMDRIEGTRLSVKSDTRWIGEQQRLTINDLWIPSLEVGSFGFESNPEMGVEFVAFVERRLPTGSWAVHPEGLWISCRPAARPVSVLIDPQGPGWADIKSDGASLESLWRLAP